MLLDKLVFNVLQLVAVAKLLTKHYKIMNIREEFIKEKGYSYFNNTVLNEYSIWLEKKITDNYQALQLQQTGVISSVFRPEWLTYDIRKKVKDLWDLPNENNSNPRTSAIKLVREIAKHNGYEIDLKKSVELVKQHCL